jgi:hypothetical protein
MMHCSGTLTIIYNILYFYIFLFWYFLYVAVFSFPDLMTILFIVYLNVPTKYSTVGTGIVKKYGFL